MSSFITIDATQDIFELVLARPVVTYGGEHSRLVHLWWRAPGQGDRVVQVYVQDQLYDVTSDTTVREMVLLLDRARPQRIELLAVPADDPGAIWRPQPGLLGSWQPAVSDRAEVAILRDADPKSETQILVTINGADDAHGPLWPTTESTTGPGVGLGELGLGPLGDDGDAWRWRRNNLTPGVHNLRFDAVDPTGQSVANPLVESVSIEYLSEPVTGLSVSEDFQLNWVTPNITN